MWGGPPYWYYRQTSFSHTLLFKSNGQICSMICPNNVKRFLMVSNKQFRKTILSSLSKQKKKAHRTALRLRWLVRPVRNTFINIVIISPMAQKVKYPHISCGKLILSGKTNNKSSEKPIIDLDYFNSTHFTKQEIENICSTYGELYKASYKSKLSQELCEELVKHDTMPSTTCTSTSTTVTPGKGKKKGKGKPTQRKREHEEVDLDNRCNICLQEYEQANSD